jgi:hypothetical protein
VKRVQYYEYMLMDKIELLQAIELHKREVTSLNEQKSMFYEYLQNAKRLSTNQDFMTWVMKKKEKKPLLAPTVNTVLNQENGTLKKFE